MSTIGNRDNDILSKAYPTQAKEVTPQNNSSAAGTNQSIINAEKAKAQASLGFENKPMSAAYYNAIQRWLIGYSLPA